jgi:hypothetical protein
MVTQIEKLGEMASPRMGLITHIEPGRWSDWIPLRGAGRNQQVPALPGLYRVRKMSGPEIDYVGQTGVSLRGRLGQLNGLYGTQMPYNDPHTAAPALWALRHRDACDFEISVAGVPGTPLERKALEATAITHYRLDASRSPLANFGGMPPGYKKSTGNNSKLVASGHRARGGPDPGAPARPTSAAVAGDLRGDPQSVDWMNWPWSEWTSAATSKDAQCIGLYRLRARSETGLLYVGQGKISARIRAHLAKAFRNGHRQAVFFSREMEASWVSLPHVFTYNLLEHENDLIAAHFLRHGYAPSAQFLG